jgi:hypothetical protein
MPPPFKTALKDSSQSAHTHALPDISILESCPTPESGFDIGSSISLREDGLTAEEVSWL